MARKLFKTLISIFLVTFGFTSVLISFYIDEPIFTLCVTETVFFISSFDPETSRIVIVPSGYMIFLFEDELIVKNFDSK